MRFLGVFSKLIVVLVSVVLLYGCASGRKDARPVNQGPVSQGIEQETKKETQQVAEQNTRQPSGNVLNEVGLEGDKIKLTASSVFPYNVINTFDPLKKIVELKGVEAGDYKDRLIVGKEGIVDVTVKEEEMSTVLEIRLSSPFDVSDVVSQNELELVLKAGTLDPATDTVKSSGERPGVATNGAIKEKVIVSNGALKGARNITGVHFRKESATLSKVEISGDGPIAPDVFTLDGRIVVDIPKVRLARLQKQTPKMPLSAIRWVEHKDKVRIVLDVAEKVNYDVVMGGNVVEIVLTAPGTNASDTAAIVQPVGKEQPAGKKKKRDSRGGKDASTTDDVMSDVQARIDRLKEEGKKPSAEKGHDGAEFPRKGLVTLDFNNAEIVPIMRLISDVSGYNIVVDPAVKGKITLKLKDVPWDKALELILDTHRLDKEVDGNILKIKPKDTANGAAKCSSQPVVIKDLTITFSNMGGAGRSIKRENIESGTGNICLDLNINLDGNTGDSAGGDRTSMGDKGDRSKKDGKH
ncbi:MAG: AMIN domain-containing protein [Nitrospirae bacterium]|uniref:AMIN domain-containing protein n=1 Tax=Candidatus Magnetobacterium casense TaxID=1455061 RepID=UPI00058BFFDA|nr:AMIN domain-containing protein [Candidatus Magnetobacterium casensis]MBF0337122.1 AMIN domain-containing protein [Nitrospirota bacterium]